MGFDEQTANNFRELEKKAKQQQPEEKTAGKNVGAITKKSATDRVNEQTAQSLEKLAKIAEKAKLVDLQTGIAEGREMANRVRAGRHLGYLTASAQHRLEDARALRQQSEAFNSHIDAQAGASEELDGIMSDLEDEIDPLESLEGLIQEGKGQSSAPLKLLK